MMLQTDSTTATREVSVPTSGSQLIALVQGSFDGWFWAECRHCTWPGDCHRNREWAQRDADEHNLSHHRVQRSDGVEKDSVSPSSLEDAFRDYRAGSYKDAVETLRYVLLTATPGGVGTTAQLRAVPNELSTRALTFIAEIARKPTQRETAAALMMVGALVCD